MRETDWEAITVDCFPLGAAGDGVMLRADLLPASTWGSNLRGLLRPSTWDRLRIAIADAANNRCEVCGDQSIGPKQRIQRPDCHEVWVFERNGSHFTQRLDRLIALCKLCHNVQHVGRGFTDDALRTLQDLNGWSVTEAAGDVERAKKRFKLMGNIEFDLDLSVLATTVELSNSSDLKISSMERGFFGNSWLNQLGMNKLG